MSNLAYTFTHYDTYGTKWEFQFYTSNVISQTEKELTDPFFSLTWEGDRIKRSRLEVHTLVRDASDVLTDDENITSVTVQKNDSNWWYGVRYDLANEVSEGDYPYVKTYAFRDPLLVGRVAKQNIETYTNLVDIVAKLNDYNLPINTYPAWYNLYEGTGTTCIYFDSFVDEWTFRDIGEDVDEESDDTELTVDQILESILQLTDAYIMQYNYRYHIVQHDYWADRGDIDVFPNRMAYYEYDANGDQLNSGAVQGISEDSDQEFSDTLKLLPTSTSFKEQPYVQATYKYEHRNKESTLIRFPGNGFTLLPGQTKSFSVPHRASNLGGDSFYFSCTASAEPLVQYDDGILASPQISLDKTLSLTNVPVYWNGSIWTATTSKVSLPGIPGVRQSEFMYSRFTFEGTIQFKTAPWASGDTLNLTIQPLIINGQEQATFFQDVEFSVIADTTDEDAEGDENSNEITYSLTVFDGVNARKGASLELPNLIIGDGPNNISRGALRYYDSDENDYLRIPKYWTRRRGSPGAIFPTIAQLSLTSHLDRLSSARKILRANLYGDYSPLQLLSSSYDGKKYSFERGRVTGRRGEWSIFVSEVRQNVETGLTYAFNANDIGYVPGVFAPTQYRRKDGIRASRIPRTFDVLRAAFGSDGSSAPVSSQDGFELLDGSVGYSTTAGDTLPYFYDKLSFFDNLNVFTSGTDDWSAASANTNLLFSSQARLGAIENGLLQMDMTTQPTSTQEFSIEKALVDLEFTGYFKCEVYVDENNGTTQGVKIVAGTQSTSTLLVGEWVPLGLLNSDPAKVEIKGTDGYGNTTYTPTFEDKIRIRAVAFAGNIFEYTNGVITNYDPQTNDWTVDQDILVARNVATDEILNFGFISSVDGSGYPTAVDVNDSYLNNDIYQVIGRWQKTVVSISGDVLTTGTLNASLVSITNFDTSGTQVIRSDTEPTQRPDATDLVGGDIWIDTNDGDRIYTWNPYPFEVWVQTLTAISGSNIVTGTIDASQVTVSNIDASNINTGTLDASVITISNLDTSDISGSTVTIRSATQPTVRGDGTALQAGDIWIDTSDGDKPYSYDTGTSAFVAAYTSIDGGDIETGTITADKLTVTNLNAVSTQTGALTVDGTLTISTGGKITGTNYELTDAGGNIAGWTIATGTLSSSSVAGVARIHLSQTNKRVSIINSSDNEIVAMGYLDGLAKNAGGGNWGATDYGFWAKTGDKLQIDGNVDYVDGDFIVQSDGVLKSSNYSAGAAGFQISGGGSAEFNDVTVRGNIQAGSGSDIDGVYISDGTVTAAKIDTGDLFSQTITIGTGGYIQSTGFTDNTAGFRLNADGSALFNNIEVSGALQTKQITLYTTDFSLDNDFAAVNSLMLVVTQAGQTDALEVTIDTGSSERYIKLPVANGRTTFQAGKDYTVSFMYYIASGQDVQEILVGTEDIYDLRYVAGVQDAWTTASFNLLQPDGNELRFYASDGYTTTYTSAALEEFYIKNVVISELSRVDGGFIVAQSITADKIAANTITADQIATGTITALQLDSNSVTADKINVTNLAAVSGTMGALTINDTLSMTTGTIEFSGTSGGMEIKKIATNTGGIVGNESLRIDGRRVEIRGTGGSVYALQADEAGYVSIADSSGVQLGFFGSQGQTKNTVTGSKGGNAALASLLTALANYGLITDSST